jgi:hypothetical protein
MEKIQGKLTLLGNSTVTKYVVSYTAIEIGDRV